jgi:hypothetical protein
MQSEQYEQSDAYTLFVYAIISHITREYYLRRLKIFFNYINLLLEQRRKAIYAAFRLCFQERL